MAINMQISGPKLIMHEKKIADMFMIHLNNNKGLFGIDCATGEEYSFSKLKNDAFAMANEFQKKNIGYGDVVLTLDYGSYEGQVVMLSGLLVGATIAALDINLNKHNLQKLISESKPVVLYCNASKTNTIAEFINTIPQPIFKISSVTRDGFTAYSNFAESDNVSFVRPKKSVSKNCPCAILYSSGTTAGGPKAIYLSDDALKSALISFMAFMEEPVENRFMLLSPISWYTGILLLMLGIHFGKPRLFFSSKPTTEQILISIDKFKPTFLMTGLAGANNMTSFQMENGHKYNIDSLTTFVVGGTVVQSESQRAINKNLLRGRIRTKQVYGSSEQGIIALWYMDSDTIKDGSVGRPGAGIEIKIVSVETGKCVGPNTEGEIYIKSVSNMIGYSYDMKKTVNSYDEEGWFKSGDVGYYTSDGCLFVVGRINEQMYYNGHKIMPIDIETILFSHPAVQDAGVTSKGSKDGDLLIGVVKIKPGQSVGPDELVSYVNDKVNDYEKLRGGVIFVDDVPRTTSGKLKLMELKNLIK